jgi:hypothetical protein
MPVVKTRIGGFSLPLYCAVETLSDESQSNALSVAAAVGA